MVTLKLILLYYHHRILDGAEVKNARRPKLLSLVRSS